MACFGAAKRYSTSASVPMSSAVSRPTEPPGYGSRARHGWQGCRLFGRGPLRSGSAIHSFTVHAGIKQLRMSNSGIRAGTRSRIRCDHLVASW